MNKTFKMSKKFIGILLVMLLFINSFANLSRAYIIQVGDKTRLYKDKILPGFIEYKTNGAIKLVARVYYEDAQTGKRLHAFCLQPNKEGIGTGAGDSYETSITKKVSDPQIWRALYQGYLGKNWRQTTVENDDDWYYVTKLVMHCLAENIAPKVKYQITSRITASDAEEGYTLAELQTRGAKILEEAQKLYQYAISGTQDYREAKVTLEKSGTAQPVGNDIVQNIAVISNKELESYEVELTDFPSGTRYAKDENIIKLEIPKEKLTKEITGNIKIKNAKVKTCPAFYAKSNNSNYQDYAVVLEPYEIAAEENLSITIEAPQNCAIEILKIDEQTKQPISGVEFEIIKEQKVIQTVTTNQQGKAYITNLIPGTYIVKETKTNENYLLPENRQKEVILEYGKTAQVIIKNEKIKGQIKIIKTSSDDNSINGKKAGSPIENVKFEIYDTNQNKIDEITTNKDGIAISKKLDKGTYTIKEIETDKYYFLNENLLKANILTSGQIVTLEVTNPSKKPQVDIEKTGPASIKPGKPIRYDFKIKNTGNVVLDNFTWFDNLPANEIKILRLITGTYNQNIEYHISYKTNKNDYKILAKNLNTKTNHYIDFSNLKLEEQEVITEFKVEFGTVGVGFESVIHPYIEAKVVHNLGNQKEFINKTSLQANHKGYQVGAQDTHKTTVKKLPKTGF